MQLFFCAEDSEPDLRTELLAAFPGAPLESGQGIWFETEFAVEPHRPLPHLVFARQWLPDARRLQAESIRDWAQALSEAVAGVLPDERPWSLHVEPNYGVRKLHRIGARAWHTAGRQGREPEPRNAQSGQSEPGPEAGQRRCELIREATLELLRKRRRHLLRQLRPSPAPFSPEDSLVQLWLTAPNSGFLSVAAGPLPFEQRHLLSPFPKGELPLASDPAAPSRAFAKLVEAELRLGRALETGETCVDLGASPGSWTYVAVARGARVTAVDRSDLRPDLMHHPQVAFQAGDAFRFEPQGPVDWLLCDVIAAPERNAELLLNWLRRGWCRRFVVTLKLKDSSGEAVLALLKRELPALTRQFFLTRLSANKKEVCAFGLASDASPDR